MDTSPTTPPQDHPPTSTNNSTPRTTEPSTKAHMSTKKRVLITIAGLILTAGLIGVSALVLRNYSQPQNDTQPTGSRVEEQKETALDRFRKSTTGEQWFDNPQIIEPLGLFKDDVGVEYRLVGKRDSKEIIHAYRRNADGNDRNHFLFEKSSDNTMTALLRPQGYDYFTVAQRSDVEAQFSGKVTAVDTVINYDSLSLPKTISLGENQRIDRIDSEGLGAFPVESPAENTRLLVDSFGESKLFTLYQFDEKYQLTHAQYQIETPLQTRITVRYFPQSTSIASYTWDNGKVPRVIDLNGLPVTDSVVPFSSGCESGGVRSTLLDKIDDADIVSVGTTGDGSPVYQFVDTKHPIISFVYTQYRLKNESQRQAVDSLTDFLNFHGIIILKNSDQKAFLYIRDAYLARYQCR